MAFDFEENIGSTDLNLDDMVNPEQMYCPLTDAIWKLDFDKGINIRKEHYSKILKNGFFSNEKPYYICDPEIYLKECINVRWLVFEPESFTDDDVHISEVLNPEYSPILVFEQQAGTYIVEDDTFSTKTIEMNVERQMELKCTLAVLFKGVFKAIKKPNGMYHLEKLWDRFYLPDTVVANLKQR